MENREVTSPQTCSALQQSSLWQREKPRNSNWGVGRLPIFPADVWVYMCGHAHPHMLMQCMHVSPLSALNSVGQRYPEPSSTFTQAASAACFAYSWIFRRGLCLLYIQKTHLRMWKWQHSYKNASSPIDITFFCANADPDIWDLENQSLGLGVIKNNSVPILWPQYQLLNDQFCEIRFNRRWQYTCKRWAPSLGLFPACFKTANHQH